MNREFEGCNVNLMISVVILFGCFAGKDGGKRMGLKFDRVK